MFSFKSYTEQCYNIGSPKPSPNRSPFKEFPAEKDPVSDFQFSPLPTQSRKCIKRKLAESDLDSQIDINKSPKKPREMDDKDKQDFMNLIAEQIAAQSKINSDLLVSTFQQTVDSKMLGLEKQIKDISDVTKTEISNLGLKLKEVQEKKALV